MKMLTRSFNPIQPSIYSSNKYAASTRHKSNKTNSFARLILLLSIALWVSTQLAGCANVKLRAGAKPNLAALENSMTQGTSTEHDVSKALGTPTGKGREMLPFMDSPRDTWTFYYEEGDLKDDRRLFLFVFFKDQHYDGYMWFSSLPEFKPMLKN
jgi:hypothetical protein